MGVGGEKIPGAGIPNSLWRRRVEEKPQERVKGKTAGKSGRQSQEVSSGPNSCEPPEPCSVPAFDSLPRRDAGPSLCPFWAFSAWPPFFGKARRLLLLLFHLLLLLRSGKFRSGSFFRPPVRGLVRGRLPSAPLTPLSSSEGALRSFSEETWRGGGATTAAPSRKSARLEARLAQPKLLFKPAQLPCLPASSPALPGPFQAQLRAGKRSPNRARLFGKQRSDIFTHPNPALPVSFTRLPRRNSPARTCWRFPGRCPPGLEAFAREGRGRNERLRPRLLPKPSCEMRETPPGSALSRKAGRPLPSEGRLSRLAPARTAGFGGWMADWLAWGSTRGAASFPASSSSSFFPLFILSPPLLRKV